MSRKDTPYIFMFRKMRNYAPKKGMVVIILIFSVISKLLRLIEPWLLGQIVNEIQINWAEWWGQIRVYLFSFVWVSLLARVFHGLSRVWEERMKFDISEAYILDSFKKVTSLPMKWQNDNHTWSTIDKINKAMYALREYSGNTHMYLNTIVFSVGSVVALAWIRWKAAAIMLLFWIVIFTIVLRFDSYLVPMIKQKNKKEHLVMSSLFDFLSNIKTLITLRFEWKAKEVLHTKIQAVLPIFLKYRTLNEWKWLSMDVLMAIVIALILWMYVHEEFMTTWVVMIGTFTMLFQYAQRMNQALENFTRQYSWIVTKKADMEAMDDVESEYKNLADTYKIDLLHARKSIQIDDLKFAYAKGEKTSALNDLSLNLIPGSKIALVGESGSGKSTLMSLLRWLYDVNSVEMKIDGKRYHDLHPLAHITSLIPQEPEIFENTIRYNIAMWLEIEDEELMRIAKIAQFDTVLKDLPNGLDTDIKEKWVNLSGGQKQRLALCRGLMVARDSDILLLDEPTSSVDSVNERSIYEAILSNYADACIVSSIHKLHLLELFDYVYVMEKGNIVQEGSLQDLLDSKGLFATMWEKYQLQE